MTVSGVLPFGGAISDSALLQRWGGITEDGGSVRRASVNLAGLLVVGASSDEQRTYPTQVGKKTRHGAEKDLVRRAEKLLRRKWGSGHARRRRRISSNEQTN